MLIIGGEDGSLYFQLYIALLWQKNIYNGPKVDGLYESDLSFNWSSKHSVKHSFCQD